MSLRIFQAIALSTTLLFSASPMVSTSMSTDNGGTKLAIDAYSDGGGVLLINQASDSKFDNSSMNKLVFKYGDEAKTSNTTLKNQVNVLSTGATALEKTAASTTLEVAKVVINPPSNGTMCDDGDPLTHSDSWVSSVCTGIPTTLNVVDLFGDGSGKALYQFENNINAGAAYGSLSYIDGKFGKALKFNGSSYANSNSTFSLGSTATFSYWLYHTGTGAASYEITNYTSSTCDGVLIGSDATRIWISSLQNCSIVPSSQQEYAIPTINNWYHVVGTVSATAKVTLYVNGVLIGSHQGAVTVPKLNTRNYLFGRTYENSYSSKALDQLRVFNKEVTAAEVLKLRDEK